MLQAVFIVIVFLPTYLQHIYFFSQTHNADEKNKRAAANTQNKNLGQKNGLKLNNIMRSYSTALATLMQASNRTVRYYKSPLC